MEPHVKRAYIALALLIAIANVAPIPVYVHMMATTLLIIYIGSHSSIPGSTTGGNTDEQQFSEQMQTKDAMMFPVFGSIVLFSLYLIFKFIPKEYVTIVIKGYFFVFGLLVLGHRFSYILAHFLPDAIVAPFRGISVTLSNPCSRIPKDATPAQIAKWKSENALTLSGVDFLGFMVATGVAVWYILTNHWAASNIFGIAFSIQGIELLSLGSFINGCILLSGLFVYDIFWVFGTDVMVTVAKSFDAPIKLLFPQAFGGSPSMLGLGDVVLPGVFIALMLRFDLSFHHDEQKAKHVKKYASNNTSKKGKGKSSRSPTPTPKPFTPTYVSGGSIDTPYFYSQMLWYFVGLSTTVFVMYYFQHAQPALLYLVPTCFIGAFGTALIRGEVRRLLYFKEDAPQAPPETLAKKIVQKTKPLEVSMAEENPPKQEHEEEEEEEEEEEDQESEQEEEEEESEPEPEPEPVKPKKTASGKAKAAAAAPAPAKTAAPAPAKAAAPAPKKKSGKK